MNNSSQYGDRKQRYKLLLDESNQLQQGIGHQLPSETCRAVQNIVQNCDNIHKETPITEKVENTSEIVMDAQLMKSVHESVSKLLLANSEFNDGIIKLQSPSPPRGMSVKDLRMYESDIQEHLDDIEDESSYRTALNTIHQQAVEDSNNSHRDNIILGGRPPPVANEERNLRRRTRVNALISQNESDNWRVIAEIAITVAKPANTKSSMLGAIDVEPKERVVKEKQQRRRTVLTQEKRPETIKQLKRDDRGAEKVNIILRQVSDKFRENNREPIPYYRLIIDPHNFMNTVENAFQIAFLARDGNVAIEAGEDGYPQVRLAPKDEIQRHTDTLQAICSLNMQLCKEMIEIYDITEPMLDVPDDLEDNDSTRLNNEEDD
ncbi:Non-structural maintenance of chromosomes element 4 like protein A [Lucilia cuprina]|nr:Non-structural maintenance of chromosomes element 4 like protein A [Lucilia cuprina]